jgi:DNA-binding NtrC family response regulator
MNIVRRTKLSTSPLGPSSALTRVDDSACLLVVLNTVSKGNTCTLRGQDSFVVGASSDADLRVEDPTVSSLHVRVHRTDGGIHIQDLDSTNGTFYEKSRIQEVVVPFGAVVELGKACIKVVPEEREVQAKPYSAIRFGGLIGQEQRMRQMFSLLADVAPTNATILIEGETGTGKELVARALHDHSERSAKPFVVFDCSAVPHDLIESSLFGHMKGSFTGATGTRKGAFRQANGGTIFLDEIGELSLDLQPKLLRALESRTIQMVGGDDQERVDVRVIAATNRNLKKEVRSGNFREDLYYRLAVVRMVLPALRERKEDIPSLIEHFVDSLAAPNSIPSPFGDLGNIEELKDYDWPGNVRELKNIVERSLSLYRGHGSLRLDEHLTSSLEEKTDRLQTESDEKGNLKPEGGLPAEEWGEIAGAFDQNNGMSFREAKSKVVSAFEKKYLEDLMLESGQNISKAAQKAKMDRKHLRELLKKNGLWGQDSK